MNERDNGELKTYYLYTLQHPESKEIRYLGATDSMSRRMSEHLSDARMNRTKFWKDNWIRSLFRSGLEPKMELFGMFLGRAAVKEAEIFWIAFLKDQGYRLTNLTAGGEGANGWVPTPEQRANMCRAQQAKILSPESLASLKNKVSAFNKGIARPPEACEKIRQAKLGSKNPNSGNTDFIPRKLTYEQACEIRQLDKTGAFTYTDLAVRFNINLSCVSSIVNNKTYLTPSRTSSHNNKLTYEQATEIRRLYAAGETRPALALKYAVTYTIINSIVQNRTYTKPDTYLHGNNKPLL